MGDGTSIEWTDATWNPIVGCSRISPGCDHCYAIPTVHRGAAMGTAQHVGLTVKPEGGRVDWTGEVRVVEHLLDQPLRWRRPRRIFVNSLSDLFHEDVTDERIARVFGVMAAACEHTFQVLTKRPQRMAKLLALPAFLQAVEDECDAHTHAGMDWPLPNVWLGVSIESDRYAFRADHLRATPAAVRWVSAEPLLGPLPSLDLTGIDWVVAGGESGPGARPMHPDWVRDIRDACPYWTSFLFKQWGAWAPWLPEDWSEQTGGATFVKIDGSTSWGAGSFDSDHLTNWSKNFDPADVGMTKVGKKAAGRELDGRTWDEYPEVGHG